MMRAGIAGCGVIAAVHAQIIKEMKDVELAGAADIRVDRADALTAAYGGRAYASLEEMIAGEALDVLHICTPHNLHAPMAKLAADHGIAVFTEKPPVIDKGQWRLLQEASRQVPVGICFQNRYNESVAFIKKLLQEQKLLDFMGGRAFVTWKREAPYYEESDWRGRLQTEGGGALINQAIHTLDLLVYFLGRPDQVEARMQNFHLKGKIEVEDTVEARLEYAGRPVLFYATTGYCMDAPVWLELAFENAVIKMEEKRVSVRYEGKEEESYYFAGGPAPLKEYFGTSHQCCIEDYYEHVRRKEAVPIGTKDIADTVDVLLAVYNSAREKKEMVLS